MQFVHQTLIWGFLIALVPLLIHLINMLRHRRVQWAAMEFLLKSYKKHRTWVWLKQLLLLLMRMAAIALIVGMLAQWVSRGQWLDMFGGRATHHYVLLDDSYSMSDRFGGTSAFESGIQAIQQLATRAAEQDSRQKFTLIRFSQAARPVVNAEEQATSRVGRIADLNAEIVDAGFALRLEEKRNTFDITELSVGPRPALELVKQLLVDQGKDDTNLVYVVSDFRSREWDAPADMREALHEIAKSPADLRLIGCVNLARPNMGIISITPQAETRAAGVPLYVNVEVKNYGAEPAEKVLLKIRTTFYEPDSQRTGPPGKTQGETAELTPLLIKSIGPGEVITQRVGVIFPEAGRHVVEANLPDDSVAADNRRSCVIDFPESERVLVVDGSVNQRNAYFITNVFQPGQGANTGIRPDVQPVAFLRDASPESLAPFSVIYLADVDRMDDRAVENLEKYVQGGGGLALFCGEHINPLFYRSKLYNDGRGLFPVPIATEDVLIPVKSSDERPPDLEPGDNPIFGIFGDERNPMLRSVSIERFWKTADNWQPPAESTVNVLAQLRNKRPLFVEQKFGDGRVVAVLTSAATTWNNWAPNPSFVVVLLKLQSYLATAKRHDEAHLVSERLDVQLDANKFRKEIAFVVPGSGPVDRTVIERSAEKPANDSPLLTASVGPTSDGPNGETERSGLYEAWTQTFDAKFQVHRWAVNVEPNEGEMSIVQPAQLIQKLEPIKVEFAYADQYQYEQVAQGGFNRSLMLMTLLIVLLIMEQALAFALSYHPAKLAAAPRR